MKRSQSILLFIVTAFSLHAAMAPSLHAVAEETTISDARALIAGGEYAEARTLLNGIVLDRNADPSVRADALAVMAGFYEEIVGNNVQAIRFYRRILDSEVPPGHRARTTAQKEISRLYALEREYGEQNDLLDRLRVESHRRGDEGKNEQIRLLSGIVEQSPRYHRLAETYYYLALNYFSLKNYESALSALEESERLKPGINFHLPVRSTARRIREVWIRSRITGASWSIAGILLAVTAIVFYASRPWRWVGFRHLLVGVTIIVLYAAVFALAHRLAGHRFEVDHELAGQIGVEYPAFISSEPDSPGAEIADILFLHGLVGLLGIYLFSLGAGRLGTTWKTIPINVIYSLLLLSSLTAIFYMRYCDRRVVFHSDRDDALSRLQGNLFIEYGNIESCLLTDPGAYPGIDITGITNPQLREWALHYFTGENP